MNLQAEMISLPEFRAYAASFPDMLPRTTALEQRIRIGTGFHGKWYQSQREHMLGWLVGQECRERKNGKDPRRVSASGMWNRLKCSPLMFWLAEGAQVSYAVLDEAERAAVAASEIRPTDGDPHGRMMRGPLSWTVIAHSLRGNADPVGPVQADAASFPAFERLIARNAGYRPLREWLVESAHASAPEGAT
ncbi:hypothetical protein [Oceaniglobus roseus]|uniref:hypothetical protein n=1 Tax=Oceaniglobus roseus TaxID=1737570 RepID=UPI000C7F5241|nr:hypothetical protein [Kandeliimicrobium roseum]